MTRQSNAHYQRAYRERQALLRTQLSTRTAALEAILSALEGNEKPLAVKLRGIAEEALK